jgi:hypothetical protein
MYPSTTLFIALGQFAIILLVLFSYPLQVHPCRICLDKILPFKGYTLSPKSAESFDAENEETEEEEEDLSAHGAVHELTPLRHTILTYLIVVPGFLVAYFVDDLQLGVQSIRLLAITYVHFHARFLSPFVCRIDWFNDHFVYSSGAILLQGLENLILVLISGCVLIRAGTFLQLFGDQPGHSKAMKWASAALALYGVLIFIFWSVRDGCLGCVHCLICVTSV